MVAHPCCASNNAPMVQEHSLPTFTVSADGPPLTPEMVDQALLDDDARITMSVASAQERLRGRVKDRSLVEDLLQDRRREMAGDAGQHSASALVVKKVQDLRNVADVDSQADSGIGPDVP